MQNPSEGITFFPAKSRTQKQKLMKPNERVKEMLDFFDSPESTALSRYKLLKEEWNRVEVQVKRMEEDWYNEFNNDVVKFVKSALVNCAGEDMEIPLGFLVTGLSTDENVKLFQSILRRIEGQVDTHLIVQLSSTQCSSMKTAFEHLLRQLIQRDNEFVEKQERHYSRSENLAKTEKTSERFISLHDMKTWYSTRFPNFKQGRMEETLEKCPDIKVDSSTNSISPMDISSSSSFNSPTELDSTLDSESSRNKLGSANGYKYSSGDIFSPDGYSIPFNDSYEDYAHLFEDDDSNPPTSENSFESRRFPPRQSLWKPIIIAIEDVDFFDVSIFKELMQLLSCSKLPIIFLVGVKHCLVNLENLIPKSVTYRYKFFNTKEPHKRLNDFMQQVVFSIHTPIRLSGPIVKYLSDCFLCQDFSVTRLKRAYKICLSEHFRLAKTFLLADNFQNIEGGAEVDLLSTLNTIPSFKGYREQNRNGSKSSRKANKEPLLQVELQDTVEEVMNDLEECRVYFKNLFAILYVLVEFAANLPNSPLGDGFQTLYSLTWDGAIFHAGEDKESISPFQQFIILVQQFGPAEMTLRISKARESLQDFDNYMNLDEWSHDTNVGIGTLSDTLKEFLEKLQNLPKHQEPVDVKSTRVQSSRKMKGMSALDFKDTAKRMRESLLRSRASPFDTLKTDIVNFLTEFAHKYMKLPSTNTLHEVFVVDDLKTLKSHVAVNIQESITKTLSTPECFLAIDNSDENNIFDTAVLHELFTEGGMKTINLNELYEQFKFKCRDEEVQTSPMKRGSPRKRFNVNEDEYLYRFRQSVAELQLLGFIKPSNINSDEVHRLGWTFSTR